MSCDHIDNTCFQEQVKEIDMRIHVVIENFTPEFVDL